uniref:Uncharacterized protein n=1 Tax=viral metagenome TaxID=1070528 RepID=A0A6H1ZK95_9ZZZZ
MNMVTQYGLLSGEGAVGTGLGQAYGLMSDYRPAAYPSFVPSQTRAPSQQNYMNYTPNQPMAQIQTPNYRLSAGAAPQYQGLMGGDYAALQTALQQPGEIAARQAYEQGQTNLINQMGGRGLYGSSIMSNQARTALEQPYMDALATNAANAAAQRYGLQSQNLATQNQFAQTGYGQQLGQEQNINAYGLNAAQLGMQQNQNVYQAGVSDAARQQDYNLAAQTYANQGTEAQRQWQNQQALEQMQYQLASGQYSNEQQTAMINQYLALAGRGQVTAGQNQATLTAQQQADAAQQQALYGNLAGLLTTGGLMYGTGMFG